MATSIPDRALPAQRLLDAASTLFAKEGIRAVGIDRILSEAKVARASLYQVYGSKDALILAYLERQDDQDRAAYARAAARVEEPVDRVLLVFDLVAKFARRKGFRGCLYLNALTEFPDASHTVSAAVSRHRTWLVDLWTQGLSAAGLADPGPTVGQLVLLYDGGLAGCKVTRSVEPIMQAKGMAAEIVTQALARRGKVDESPLRSA
jgi:AcrR family transcriptional regulator